MILVDEDVYLRSKVLEMNPFSQVTLSKYGVCDDGAGHADACVILKIIIQGKTLCETNGGSSTSAS